MGDPRLELARKSVEAVIAEQYTSRRTVRTLSLTLLAAGAVAETLGASRITATGADRPAHVFGYLSVAAFLLLLTAVFAVVRSQTGWTYGTSGRKIMDWIDEGCDIDEINRKTTRELIVARDDNAKILDRQATLFLATLAALAAAVVLSALAAVV